MARVAAFKTDTMKFLPQKIQNFQKRKNFSMSAKLGFKPQRSKMDVQRSRMQQKKRLPSRDRTAGLKITKERDLLQQLQSCALPAELRRVIELCRQLLDDSLGHFHNMML